MNDQRTITRDGQPQRQFRCPRCGIWGDIDDDQFHGRVSIYHDGCDFHETIDLAGKTLRVEVGLDADGRRALTRLERRIEALEHGGRDCWCEPSVLVYDNGDVVVHNRGDN